MATRYKLYKDDSETGVNKSIKRILDDGTITSIPMSAQRAWREYQEWLAAGNTPEAAD